MDVMFSVCVVRRGTAGPWVWEAFTPSYTSVFAIIERRDMGQYEVPLSISVLGFGMGAMLANFHMCGIMLV